MKNALFTLFLVMCLHTAVSAQQYAINARITGFKDGTRFYLNDVGPDINIDSAVIKNGRFSFNGKLGAEPKSLWVTATVGQNYYYFTLLMGNEKIDVRGDVSDFPFDLKITGSKTQDVHNKMIELTREGYKERNKLVAEYQSLSGDSAKSKGKAIWKRIAKIDSVDRIQRMDFVRHNLNSYEGLDALFYLKNDFPKDTVNKFYHSLDPAFKNTGYAKRIKTFLAVGNVLETGDSFWDFSAFDKGGRKHLLSEHKGRYILLDFSSTYCGPCIESVPELKKIAQEYSKVLSVVSFSADAGKETWLKGINRDQPQWLSLWDGKGLYGETIIKYGVTGYPTFVLIDPEGKIVSKWSGYYTGAVLKEVQERVGGKE
jgi:thiol-disulfide isomerase/thioredoxin